MNTEHASEPSNLGLCFDNRFTRELPADPETDNYRRQVEHACYSRVQPTRVAQPRLLAYAWEVAQDIGLSRAECESDEFVEVFSGNRVLPGMDPYAMCYGGHQFGSWAGQLGDGRAINLGEIVNQGRRWVVQLKGAGPTPYSRQADGLAVLRSSLREFLCSEAMHHLGVPTTRALSLIATGEQVVRDMFYDGNPKPEPGAVVCRVAPSFTRFGNFQLFAARGETEVLRQLLDYTIRTDFPHLGQPSPAVYLAWFQEVCRTTARLIVDWLRVGFVHGVMNTDNMSILGLTIDYGPYGWLEDYDPKWTPNTTDAVGRRYCFGNQPQIAQWNLAQLANAVLPLIGQTEALEETLSGFVTDFENGWRSMMAAKLGLRSFEPQSDDELLAELLAILGLVETDMPIFYRRLAQLELRRPRLWPGTGRRRSPARAAAGRLLRARTAEPCSPDADRQLAASLCGPCPCRRDLRRNAPETHERRQSQICAAQLSGPTGHRQGRAGRFLRCCTNCSTCCATPMMTSPTRTTTPKSGPTGRVSGRAARCCRAAPDPAVHTPIRP